MSRIRSSPMLVGPGVPTIGALQNARVQQQLSEGRTPAPIHAGGAVYNPRYASSELGQREARQNAAAAQSESLRRLASQFPQNGLGDTIQLIRPFVESGVLDPGDAQRLISGAVADTVGSQLDFHNAQRDVEAINRAYAGGRIDHRQYQEAMATAEQRYGPDTLVRVPEYQRSAEVQAAVQEAQQQQLAHWEQQNQAQGYGVWDEKAGRPTFNQEKITFEKYRLDRAAKLQEIQDKRNAPQVEQMKVREKVRGEAYKQRLTELHDSIYGRLPAPDQKSGGFLGLGSSVDNTAEAWAEAHSAFEEGSRTLQQEFYPESVPPTQNKLPPQQLAEASGKKFYATPEAAMEARRRGELGPQEQFVGGDGQLYW